MNASAQLTLAIGNPRDTFVVGKPPAARDSLPRRCECCKKRLPRKKYSNAITCSKRCRQTLSRRRLKLVKVSRGATAKRRLSECARRRALEGVPID